MCGGCFIVPVDAVNCRCALVELGDPLDLVTSHKPSD